MSAQPKCLIVLVDDDKENAEIISAALTAEGFQVKTAYNLFQGRSMIDRLKPDLVVLDRRLPDGDGLELCREIRQHPQRGNLPVLFLSAKNSVAEKVVGLKMGADDYLPKPFSSEELIARVQALLRRAKSPEPAIQAIKWGELAMDLSARTVTLKGKPLELWPKEFDLLQAFLESRGRVLSREFLLERIWGYERGLEVTTRVVDVTVSNLRAKLGRLGKSLVTVKQHGYRLEDPS